MAEGKRVRPGHLVHDVVIAGGGPTGLMLAAELALARVDVAIIERRPTQELTGIRAGGLHARTIELLDQRGVAERFLAEGTVMQVAGFALIPLDISDFPTRHPYGLALTQNHIERLLAAWLLELNVPIYRARELVHFSQNHTGVEAILADGTRVNSKFLVGCDGGRSTVRKQAGIEFPGWDPSVTYLIAEAEMHQEPASGVRRGDRGINALGKIDDGKRVRAVLVEPEVVQGAEPTVAELQAALVAVYGTDFGVHNVTWLSRFSDAARQAASYRGGRVFLAGDAAHIHSPAGGQGLNLGVHDAVNLAWKLARVVHGRSPDSLLDTYHAERHPFAARVLEATLAQTALARGDERTSILHRHVATLLGMDEPRKRYGGMMSGLDVHYEMGAGHPLLGRRMPDLELTTEEGAVRVFSLLHEARPVLLDLGQSLTFECDAAASGVKCVRARYAGPWELPVVGAVEAPTAVLVRPDGYVAWVGLGSGDGLSAAIEMWFGSA